jgi:phage tail-like protein
VTTFRTLTVSFGGQVLMTSTLSKSPYAIGELPNNDLPLPEISPSHAEIRIISGRAFLTDLGSQQGTLVAGVPLQPHQPQLLVDGVTIRIGPYDIVYRSAIDQPGDALAPAEPQSDEESLASSEQAEVVVDPVIRRLRSPAAANGSFAIGRYASYLPVIFDDSVDEKENPFLPRFLKIFESIWEPLEQRQDNIDMFFSPRTCPSPWLPWFASWFGLELDPSLSEARVRMLLANTIEIYRWRGTKYGLTRVIEICLGIRPVITETPSEPNVFRVRVRLPADATPDFVPRLRALLSAHKPAHTGYVIEVQK